MTRVPCPACGHHLRLDDDDDDDVELAVHLHGLSGRCTGRPHPKPALGKSSPITRIRTIDEELEAIGW